MYVSIPPEFRPKRFTFEYKFVYIYLYFLTFNKFGVSISECINDLIIKVDFSLRTKFFFRFEIHREGWNEIRSFKCFYTRIRTVNGVVVMFGKRLMDSYLDEVSSLFFPVSSFLTL